MPWFGCLRIILFVIPYYCDFSVSNEMCLYCPIWSSTCLSCSLRYSSTGWQLETFCFPEGGAIAQVLSFLTELAFIAALGNSLVKRTMFRRKKKKGWGQSLSRYGLNTWGYGSALGPVREASSGEIPEVFGLTFGWNPGAYCRKRFSCKTLWCSCLPLSIYSSFPQS